MSLHELIESRTDGSRHRIGGALTEMDIGAVNGPLSEISIQPVSVEEMKGELFEADVVIMQVGDRIVRFESDQVDTVIELLLDAKGGGLHNLGLAFPDEPHEPWSGTGVVPDYLQVVPGSVQEHVGSTRRATS